MTILANCQINLLLAVCLDSFCFILNDNLYFIFYICDVQSPPPIYQAQPAATLAPTSGNMRGDTKWPPESVKQQTEAENRARVDLAKGPAFRPRRVAKDYTSFFAQHALNSNYPGYRAPPGTQYFTPAYQQ